MKESIKNFIWERREIFLIIAILFFIGMPCIALLCHNFLTIQIFAIICAVCLLLHAIGVCIDNNKKKKK